MSAHVGFGTTGSAPIRVQPEPRPRVTSEIRVSPRGWLFDLLVEVSAELPDAPVPVAFPPFREEPSDVTVPVAANLGRSVQLPENRRM